MRRHSFSISSEAIRPWVWGGSRPPLAGPGTEVIFCLEEPEGLLLSSPQNKLKKKNPRQREDETVSFNLMLMKQKKIA